MGSKEKVLSLQSRLPRGFEFEDRARPWFCLVLIFFLGVASFPIGLSSRTMQDLGFVFRELIVAKTPFNCSSGSEDIRTYLLELVPPRSPLELLCAAATSLNQGPMGLATRFAGV